MYSFYGGQPGYSFIIVASYESVNDMVTAFKKGPDYTTVHFDEHVLINTVNKNDPDNGKIYRRGYDFNNEETGGAEFVGTIVGPSGNSPILQLTTIDDVQNQYHSEGEGIQERYNHDFYTVPDGNLVPGKYINNNQEEAFNDSIEWASYSVRDVNNVDTTAYIGFKIPYPVIEFSAKSINNPYATPTTELDPETVQTHPFYKKWQIGIPKGVKGDSVGELMVRVPIGENDGIEYLSPDLKTKDIELQNEVLVYNLHNYDNNAEGSTRTIYLGPYRAVKNIEVNEDGDVLIHYTHGGNSTDESGNFEPTDDYPYPQEETLPHAIRMIDNISSPDGKVVNFHCTDGTEYQITLDMDYGKGVTIDTSLTWRGAGTESYAAGMITESLKGINNFFKRRVVIKNKSLNRLPDSIQQHTNGGTEIQYLGLAPGYLTKFGVFQPSTVYWTTDFIPLFNDSKEFDDYSQDGFFIPYIFCYLNEQNVLTEKPIKEMIFYDINYKYIGAQYHTNNDNVKASDIISNGHGSKKYVRFSFQKIDDQSNLMFLIDGNIYSREDQRQGRIPNLAANINYFIENTNTEESAFGTNYKIAVFGDGIVGGAYNNNKSYITMACEQLGITYDLHFFGGICLADGIQTWNDGTSGGSRNIAGLASEIQNSWLEELQNNNYDLIYIATTSNDWYYTGLPTRPNVTYDLGTMTDQTYNTFYGAMHKLCQTMKYVKAPVVFATPLKKWIDKTGQGQQYEQIDGKLNYQSKELNLWREAVLRVCEYHGFPVFDLYKESFFTPWIGYDRQTYTVAINEKFGSHPNDAGHTKIARRFKGILREYLPFV